jgi:hypothetical protein
MKGKIITHREVAARWSYAEITGRFAAEYATRHPEAASVALMTKIRSGTLFDDLNQAERDQLSNWFDTGYRRDYATVFNAWYRSFRGESWTKSQLAAVYTPSSTEPSGEGRDAAVAADAVPTASTQQEPLIIGHRDDGKLALWEGTCRASLFARAADEDAQILVWVPYDGNWPGRVFGATPHSLEYNIFGLL